MRVYRLVVFGYELFSWEIERDSAEVLAEAIAELADTPPDTEGDEVATSAITGAGTHDFERDPNPVDPNDRYDWEFGFHPPGEP